MCIVQKGDTAGNIFEFCFYSIFFLIECVMSSLDRLYLERLYIYDCVHSSIPCAIKHPIIEIFEYPKEMSHSFFVSEKTKKTWGITGQNWWGGIFFCTA